MLAALQASRREEGGQKREGGGRRGEGMVTVKDMY